MIPLDTALRIIREVLAAPRTKSGRVPLREAQGRVLAADVALPPAAGLASPDQDVKCGEIVARAGERLTAVRLAHLLSAGVEEVPARRRARVTIASTGADPVARAAGLAPGRILDTNGPLLEMILRGAGCTAGAHVAIPDDQRETKARLAGMLGQSDLVVLTGEVPAGDRDFVPDALRALDFTVHFDRVAVQPGRSALFATGARGVVFALPGNPVSAFVTAHLFVLPALALLEGAQEWPRFVTLPLAEAWSGRVGDRVRLYLACLTGDGGVRLLPDDESGHLRALIEADGLVRIEPEWDGRAAEAPVQFWPLRVAAFAPGEGEESS